MKRVIGAGGGGKGGSSGGKAYTPTTAGDSLDSVQYAQLIDLISEGEIEGLKDGLKSVYVNNTPLQNPDGSLNFKDVAVYTRNGTQTQTAIPIASATEDEKPVGVAVTYDQPLIRAITDVNVDAVRVTITFPQFQTITQQGDILGTAVKLAIDVQYNGGGFTNVIVDTVSGRSGDQYQRDYIVQLTGTIPAEIRVRRLSADSGSSLTTNEFAWTSYTEIIYGKLQIGRAHV